MKRTFLLFQTAAVIVCLSVPAFAQRGGGGGGSMGGMGGMGGYNSNNPNSRTYNPNNPNQNQNQNQSQADSYKAIDDLKKNPALSKRFEALLPNADVSRDARGFSSVNDLMATAHASKNLNLKFSELRKQVTGKNKVSLDKAILRVSRNATPEDAKTAAKTAKQQGEQDIKDAKAEMKAEKQTKS
jgi:hypothetical protein